MTRPAPSNSLLPGRAASFAEPFEMLAACHDRILRMLDLLQRLRDHLRTQGNDSQARQAARDVLRYFDQAAPEHHRDEELHVFPPLLAQGDPAQLDLVRRLQRDHRAMEQGWAAARPLLEALAEGRRDALEASEDAVLAAFAALHFDHLAAEDRVAYPAAQAVLDAGTVAAMGREMMTRRGIP